MEESVTRKFVHEGSSSITSLCGKFCTLHFDLYCNGVSIIDITMSHDIQAHCPRVLVWHCLLCTLSNTGLGQMSAFHAYMSVLCCFVLFLEQNKNQHTNKTKNLLHLCDASENLWFVISKVVCYCNIPVFILISLMNYPSFFLTLFFLKTTRSISGYIYI